LLHPGHIYFLLKAKERGDYLIVGLFDDALVKKIKGEKRPIEPYDERKEILISFEPVNSVLAVNNILEFLQTIHADVIVMGVNDNYLPKGFPDKFKGEVYKIEILEHYSTSKIIEKIKSVDTWRFNQI